MSRILVLPGIGDIYWVMTKVRSFAEREGLGVPEVWIWDFDGRRRSIEYVERIPFVTAGGYFTHGHDVPAFRESYLQRGRSIWPGLLGFDFYLSVNGVLRHGGTVDDAMPGYDTDWFFPLRQTAAEIEAEQMYRSRFGPYVVLHFSGFGMFAQWIRHWTAPHCAEFIRRVERLTGRRLVLTGSSWDAAFANDVARLAKCDNLVGQTNLDQFFGLFGGADGCAGWCGGNTILATYLRKPTLILWSRYFRDVRFYRNACPPESWERWYHAATVEQMSPQRAAELFARMLTAHTVDG